jgi:hypothetical protein
MINVHSKLCLSCGSIIQGRADKKFCSDQCRSNYNNQIKTGNRDYIRRVNYILKKNRRILTELYLDGHDHIGLETLKTKGFDFNYFTSLYPTEEGVNYFCYEHGFVRSDKENFIRLVVKNI